MENKAHALVAGVFLLLLGAALAAVTVWLRGDHIQRVTYTVVSDIGVPGLALKAAVKMRGVDVGTVESIGFDPKDVRRIDVGIAVDSAVPLSRGTFAQLGYQGVTGLSFIDLSDAGTDPSRLADLPDGQRRIELRPSILDKLATNGPALLAAVAETADRLNGFLTPENQARFSHLLANGEQATQELAQRAQELKSVMATLPPLVRDVRQAAAHADSTLGGIDVATAQVGQLATDARGKMVALDRAGDAAARVDEAVRSIELSLIGPDERSSPPLLGALGRAAQGVDRAAGQLSEQPQSLLFGRPQAPPGPGEPGFDASAKGRP